MLTHADNIVVIEEIKNEIINATLKHEIINVILIK